MTQISIKNGVLFAGGLRVLLSHLASYEYTNSCVVITTASGARTTINLGTESEKLAKALDEYFLEEGEPIDLSSFHAKGI